jgi:hypothetical protein
MDGTALVYCEGAFGTLAGKTTHGLVRFTERYRVVGVIDSALAGRDAGAVLDGVPNGTRSSPASARRSQRPAAPTTSWSGSPRTAASSPSGTVRTCGAPSSCR